MPFYNSQPTYSDRLWDQKKNRDQQIEQMLSSENAKVRDFERQKDLLESQNGTYLQRAVDAQNVQTQKDAGELARANLQFGPGSAAQTEAQTLADAGRLARAKLGILSGDETPLRHYLQTDDPGNSSASPLPPVSPTSSLSSQGGASIPSLTRGLRSSGESQASNPLLPRRPNSSDEIPTFTLRGSPQRNLLNFDEKGGVTFGTQQYKSATDLVDAINSATDARANRIPIKERGLLTESSVLKQLTDVANGDVKMLNRYLRQFRDYRTEGASVIDALSQTMADIDREAEEKHLGELSTKYADPNAVRDAFRRGELGEEDALNLLQRKHGYQ